MGQPALCHWLSKLAYQVTLLLEAALAAGLNVQPALPWETVAAKLVSKAASGLALSSRPPLQGVLG